MSSLSTRPVVEAMTRFSYLSAFCLEVMVDSFSTKVPSFNRFRPLMKLHSRLLT